MSKYNYLELTIGHVNKGNFNDFYCLEKVHIDLKSLSKDELVWIDPYNGHGTSNDKIAIKNYTDDYFIICEIKDNNITEAKYPIDFLYICSENFDNSSLLVSHIQFRKEKPKG